MPKKRINRQPHIPKTHHAVSAPRPRTALTQQHHLPRNAMLHPIADRCLPTATSAIRTHNSHSVACTKITPYGIAPRTFRLSGSNNLRLRLRLCPPRPDFPKETANPRATRRHSCTKNTPYLCRSTKSHRHRSAQPRLLSRSRAADNAATTPASDYAPQTAYMYQKSTMFILAARATVRSHKSPGATKRQPQPDCRKRGASCAASLILNSSFLTLNSSFFIPNS